MNTEIIEMLKELASKETLTEADGNAYDASGGNYETAYYIGWEDGEIALARKILKMIGEK